MAATVWIGSPLNAETVQFSDPFSILSVGDDTDVNANIPARQSGILAGGTYTELPTNPAGFTSDALIEKNSAPFGNSDVLVLRSLHGSTNGQMAVRHSTDFGPAVAGKIWRVSFTANLQRSSANISDTWLSLDLGDTADHVGPNNASTDIGFFVRGNGGWTTFADNVNIASGAAGVLKSPDLYATNCSIVLTIDETVVPATASASVAVSGGSTSNLGPWNVTWENAARYLELRTHNSGNALDPGATTEGRIENLTVTIVDNSPTVTTPLQPQVVMFGESVALSVTATSDTAMTYQWEKDGQSIPGATTSKLVLNTATLSTAGSYTVTVTNPSGSATSSAAVSVVYPNRWQRTAEPLAVSSKKTAIIFSEIHPHPAPRPDGKNLEFIELYNTNPWPEDLTGWRLSSDVDYTFPPGTTVPAQGFLVVAAAPGDVQSVYGITGVLGPWTGALSNEGSTLRLRRANDAIVLEAVWNDGPNWPVAADGTGHSLVLARPSYGEGDARAWTASTFIGGSPGFPETLPTSPQDHVVINEIVAHSIAGTDFIELYNSSPLSVDISGCHLSDDPAILGKYTIAPGTVLPPQGRLAIDEAQLGFALSADGETIFFADGAQTRVLDAVRFRGQLADTASGRFPDGEGAIRRLVSATAGAANTPAARGPVIINELYFHPITGDADEEWLELRNLSSQTLDLAGWRLSDGIDFTFPAGASIAANGYLVVARNPVRVLANHPALTSSIVFGPFTGSLADRGESVVLSRPVTLPTGLTYFAAIDEVAYAEKSRWSQWADGGGSSLELAEPRDASTPFWLDSDETAKAPWTVVETTGVLDHTNTNVNAIANRLDACLLNAGEALLDEVEALPNGGANAVPNGGFETGIGGWQVQGTHNRSTLATTASAGINSMRLVSTGRGDTLMNHVRSALSTTIAANTTATLRAKVRWQRGSPEFLLRLRGGGLEAYGRLTVPTNLGTPGVSNSRSVANLGPAITGVTHLPVRPVAGLPFRIFAQVTDPDGVATVTARYRLDPSTALASVPMVDTGTGGDLLEGDGIYTGVIPAQAAGTLVAFVVSASDKVATSAAFPPTGECLARVGETQRAGAFGTYTMWITSSTLNAWTARLLKSNEPFPVTLLHNGSRVLYGTGAHFASFAETANSNPLTQITGYEIDLPPGETLFGEDDVTLDWPVRDVTNQREQLMHWMLEQMKLPTLHRRDVHLVVNGQARTSATVPIYHDCHQPGGAHLESTYGDDAGGRLLKTSRWDESSDTNTVLAGPLNSLLPFTTTGGGYKVARYRWSWQPRASKISENDFSAFFSLVSAANATSNYVGGVRAVVDVDQWMRSFAFADLCAYWDTFGNSNAKNAYIYKPPAGRWNIITNDMDVGLGADINTASPPSSFPLFTPGIDPPVQKMFDTPALVRPYWRALSEAIGTFFSGSAVTTRLTRRYAGYIAQGVPVTSPFVGSGPYGLTIPAWINQRVTYVQNQLSTVAAPFVVNGPAAFTTTTSTVTVTGSAPVTVASLTFNGLELPLNWSNTTNWSATVTVPSGTHPLVIRALDSAGTEIGSQTLSITYTGTSAWPALRIAEWLARNAGRFADPADGDTEDWIELHNPTGASVNLEGWTLSDSGPTPATFVIPSGYSISAGGRLLVWADNEVAQNTGIGQLHVSFKLSDSGETLTLRAPDGTVIDTVTFGTQVENISQGRTREDAATIDFLADATPGAANTAALAPPSASATIAGGTVTFIINTTPGFTYQAQYTDDLTGPSWTNFGTPMTATGATLSISDTPAPHPMRFYRAVRTP